MAESTDAAALRGTTQRMSPMRRTIGHRMLESLSTSAQLTSVVEADVTGTADLRRRMSEHVAKSAGVKLTLLPFFAVAALRALRDHPVINASIEPEQRHVSYHDSEDLSVAVDTPRGLLAPVIENAGELNVIELACKIADVAARAREGKCAPDELQGGTFTITNTGSRGSLIDTPIINQPQVAILGTGAVVERPVVMRTAGAGSEVVVRAMMHLSLSYDHRLVDGSDAARYLGDVKRSLETVESLVPDESA